MERITVIVPVYKVEPYLAQCVDSVLAQTWQNWECILVDDGSPDGCPAICDEYAERDPRIRVIHKANGGLSDARNAGLDAAGGDYITFLDSDDVLHPQFLEVLMAGIQSEGADLSICGYCRFSGEQPRENASGESRVLTRVQALGMLNEWRSEEATEMVVACMKLYRRALFDGLRFRKGVLHEDEFLTHEVLDRCGRVVRNSAKLYYYRINEQSIMGTVDQQKAFVHLIVLEALGERIDFFAKKEPSLVCGAVHHLLRECNSFYDEYGVQPEPIFREKEKWIVRLYRRYYCRYFGSLSNAERIKGALFGWCPKLYHGLAAKTWKG